VISENKRTSATVYSSKSLYIDVFELCSWDACKHDQFNFDKEGKKFMKLSADELFCAFCEFFGR
jgi:hypothetical protein